MRSLAALSLALLLQAAHAAETPKDCPPTAQAPTAEQMQQARAAAKDRGALWRLSKDGRSSYLYGTVHVGRMAWAFPGPQLQKALKSTEVVAVEIDLSSPTLGQEMQAAQQRAAALVLTPAEQQRLDAQADAACLPRGALAGFHPVMQAITYVSLAGRRDGLDPAFAQEGMLLGTAKALQRSVVSLESVASQMALLLPQDAQQARWLLRNNLDALESAESRGSLLRLSSAWERGDLAALSDPAKLCACTPSAEELDFYRRLNDERNPHLAQRITEEHGKGRPVLAAVGLLHMTGAQALPKLLAGQGFKVERLH